jgi:hypothetical protein
LVLRKPAHTTYHDKQNNLSRQEKTMVNCMGNSRIAMILLPQKYGRMKQKKQDKNTFLNSLFLLLIPLICAKISAGYYGLIDNNYVDCFFARRPFF